MDTAVGSRRVTWILAIILAGFGVGCDLDAPPRPPASSPEPPVAQASSSQETPPAKPAPAEEPRKETTKPVRVPVGKNVFFERFRDTDRRRVVINAYVCLREGALEQLMCRQHTKEHEAILAADVDARDIHKALLAAKARLGSTVRYEEKDGKPVIIPPTGQRIHITLQYEDKGKVVTVPAQRWVRNARTKKDLDHGWVFAGSHFIEDPDNANKPPLYAANAGDVITVSNFEGAMLDLPIASSKDNDELQFEANTDRIPPLDTKVTVILEPVPDAKKK
jgi:hypothetical protein